MGPFIEEAIYKWPLGRKREKNGAPENDGSKPFYRGHDFQNQI